MSVYSIYIFSGNHSPYPNSFSEVSICRACLRWIFVVSQCSSSLFLRFMISSSMTTLSWNLKATFNVPFDVPKVWKMFNYSNVLKARNEKWMEESLQCRIYCLSSKLEKIKYESEKNKTYRLRTECLMVLILVRRWWNL